MRPAELDNPIWHALRGPHRRFAEVTGDAAWYPSTIAPFIAIPSAGVVPNLTDAADRGLRHPAYFVGAIPVSLPEEWDFVARSHILQMLPTSANVPDASEDGIRVLGTADRPSMLALMRIAFPDFFRERTAELGEYLGIFAGGKLVAMAGERFAFDGLQEISGVCTHPDFVGRGYARRLTQALMRRHRQRGVGSFLHVSEENVAARRLYESMGFVVRASLPIGKIDRRNS
jgi:ribosomal protein S18 acetylase RimI-like enzyme